MIAAVKIDIKQQEIKKKKKIFIIQIFGRVLSIKT